MCDLFKVSNLHPLVPWLRLIFKHLTLIIIVKYTICQLSGHHYFIANIMIGMALFNDHLRSVGFPIIETPSHPKSALDNQSLRTGQCSWKGGEGSPCSFSREECQHRRKVLQPIESPSNNKSLRRLNCEAEEGSINLGWTGLTPVGRAAQAWLNLFSGSWGSSSTKPLMLYLQHKNELGGILTILSLVHRCMSNVNSCIRYL